MLKDPRQFVYLLQVRQPLRSGGVPSGQRGASPAEDPQVAAAWEQVGLLMPCGINPCEQE